MEPEQPAIANPILRGPAGPPPPGAAHADDSALRALHPNVLSVWRLSAGISAGIFALFGVCFVIAAYQTDSIALYAMAGGSGLIAAMSTWSLVQYSVWRYRAWRYAVRSHDIVATFGVFWRTRRCVPRLRIQHVDIASGPIDRAFGMANVSLFTAGNIAAVITIPGVTPEEAERLRETLLKLEPSDERRPAPPASGQHAD